MEVRLENAKLSLCISTSGAELTSIKSKETGIEYLWQADPELWARHAPILFPIVGKLKDSKYNYNGQQYTLPQHGFARDNSFETCMRTSFTNNNENCQQVLYDRFNKIEFSEEIAENTASSATFRLKASESTLEDYPFNFILEINYTLRDYAVKISYKVKNVGDKTLPFSIGAHPGFNCPLKDGESFEDYYLEFDQPEDLKTFYLKDGLLSGETYSLGQNIKTLPLTKSLFDKDALIFKNLNSKRITLKSKANPHSIDLNFAGFPYLSIWTKPGTSSFICLVPWLGVADYITSDGNIMTKEGIQLLEPQETHNSSYVLEIH